MKTQINQLVKGDHRNSIVGTPLSRKKITNLQMQKIADQNEANCPIDKKGNLQAKVNKDTAYIVDANAKMKGKKMKVLMDRDGNYFYFIEVKRWW